MISVIIPVYGQANLVAKCTTSLVSSGTEPKNIWIADDGPELDESPIIEKFCVSAGVNYRRNSINQGYTRTVNRLLRSVETEFAVVLNSDTVLPRYGIDRLVKWLRTDSYLGLVSPLSNAAGFQSIPFLANKKEPLGGARQPNSLPRGFDLESANRQLEAGMLNEPLYIPSAHGFCLGLRTKMFREIGGFDEINFPVGYGEEVDLSIRAIDAGWLVGLAFDTYVWHHKSQSFGASRRLRLVAQAKKKLLEKHGANRIEALNRDLRGIKSALLARSDKDTSEMLLAPPSGETP